MNAFAGVLYAGMMITKAGPMTLEFNCRFGDPETQVLMTLLESDLYTIMKACAEGTLKQQEVMWNTKLSAVGVVIASKGYPETSTKGCVISAARGARLGVAQRDRTPTHQDYHISRECEKPPATMPSRSRPTPTGTNAGRPACVCAAEHAAPAPGPACYFVTTLNLLRSRIYTTAPKLMSPHFNSFKMQAARHRGHPDVQSALVRPSPALTGR
ncbi:Trifunctional purine biosynthetic protein adenosine-3 [Eumeta japonica]|uniref:Trifunctional purine biosynthetic protein adenosine-3 n=1 Tax=Eumeta variegata TaxID=151549 RepID=A0A4C1YAN5_EUMVA|nr:Trifunctional purine biosynthetic protein adenosine-3 [Eumeta japonica]